MPGPPLDSYNPGLREEGALSISIPPPQTRPPCWHVVLYGTKSTAFCLAWGTPKSRILHLGTCLMVAFLKEQPREYLFLGC